MLTIGEFVAPILDQVTTCLKEKDYRTACTLIYDKILEMYIIPAFFMDTKLEPFPVRYDRMFRRYMMGQANIFSRHQGVSDTDVYFRQIDKVLSRKELVTVEQGEAIRGFYNEYLRRIRSLSLATDDDVNTFSQVFPLFEPLILSYEANLEGADHASFCERIVAS